MKIRDRIKDFRRVAAAELRPNPKNWRTHSKAQREALKGLLVEVGVAGAVLAYDPGDGLGLMLIDGHLRTEELKGEVPTLVLDVTTEEADKILATFDPISALAGQDDSKLVSLLQQVDSDSAAVQKMLADLLPKLGDDEPEAEPPPIPEKFEVLVTCETEQDQAGLLQELLRRGLKCRSLIS